MEIRPSYDRLISTMRFPILVRWHLYIESGPSLLQLSFKGPMMTYWTNDDLLNQWWLIEPMMTYWTNDDLLSIDPLGTNLCEISIEMQTFLLTKVRLKTSSAKFKRRRNNNVPIICSSASYLHVNDWYHYTLQATIPYRSIGWWQLIITNRWITKMNAWLQNFGVLMKTW